MNSLLKVSAVAAVITFAAPAQAGDTGISLGLRAAYAIPLGTAGESADFNDLTSGAIPVQLDFGYRLDSHWMLGAYFSWGYAMVADRARSALAAAGATDIGGHAVQRFGIQGVYRFNPLGEIVPWAGLAVGYESTRYATFNLKSATGSHETEIGLGGLEGMLQVGGEYRLAKDVSVGPFASFSLGQFGEHLASTEGSGAVNVDVSRKALHEWLQVGLKGSFDF